MRIIKITRNRVSKRALAEAERVLSAGGVVAFPTETAYGLAADPANAAAMRKVFAIKARPKGKPLPFVAASVEDVQLRFVLEGAARKIARKHWPAPLTLVLDVRGSARHAHLGREKDGAVRVPASAWARAIARAAGGLATSTSANVSGDATLYRASEVIKSFGARRARPDLLLDAGSLPRRAPSTIARVTKKGGIEVLRQGSVKLEKKKKNSKSPSL